MIEEIKLLNKSLDECCESGYFFYVPSRLLWKCWDKFINDEDVLIFRPLEFNKNYIRENECSVADDSVDAEGRLGQE